MLEYTCIAGSIGIWSYCAQLVNQRLRVVEAHLRGIGDAIMIAR